MENLKERIIRALKLDAGLYEEVEADKTAMSQAMIVVLLSGVAAGIGTISVSGFGGLFSGAIIAVIGWFLWAYLAFLIGTKIMPEPQTKADPGELLRTIGFAAAPGMIRVIAIIPLLHDAVFAIASIWMIAALVIAVKQALDYKSTLRAVSVCVIAWIIQVLVLVGLVNILGLSAKPV